MADFISNTNIISMVEMVQFPLSQEADINNLSNINFQHEGQVPELDLEPMEEVLATATTLGVDVDGPSLVDQAPLERPVKLKQKTTKLQKRIKKRSSTSKKSVAKTMDVLTENHPSTDSLMRAIDKYSQHAPDGPRIAAKLKETFYAEQKQIEEDVKKKAKEAAKLQRQAAVADKAANAPWKKLQAMVTQAANKSSQAPAHSVQVVFTDKNKFLDVLPLAIYMAKSKLTKIACLLHDHFTSNCKFAIMELKTKKDQQHGFWEVTKEDGEHYFNQDESDIEISWKEAVIDFEQSGVPSGVFNIQLSVSHFFNNLAAKPPLWPDYRAALKKIVASSVQLYTFFQSSKCKPSAEDEKRE